MKGIQWLRAEDVLFILLRVCAPRTMIPSFWSNKFYTPALCAYSNDLAMRYVDCANSERKIPAHISSSDTEIKLRKFVSNFSTK